MTNFEAFRMTQYLSQYTHANASPGGLIFYIGLFLFSNNFCNFAI